jgi:hypothetical protein
MATSAPIEYDEQAKGIADGLDAWAADRGGSAKVVPNLKQLFKQSAMDSQSLRILVCFGGAKRRGPFSTANATHREDRTWKVAVTKGQSLGTERGEYLTDETGDTHPFLREIAQVRDLCRGFYNLSEEGPTTDYEGIEPMQLGDYAMDGYLITFTTANSIPQPATNQEIV